MRHALWRPNYPDAVLARIVEIAGVDVPLYAFPNMLWPALAAVLQIIAPAEPHSPILNSSGLPKLKEPVGDFEVASPEAAMVFADLAYRSGAIPISTVHALCDAIAHERRP